MNILITGAAGFIGSHLWKRLLVERHHVVGLDNCDAFYSRAQKETAIEHVRAMEHAVFVECDLADQHQVASLLETARPDVVFHLAGRGGVTQSTLDPLGHLQRNLADLICLLEEVRKCRSVRLFVNPSSSSVYGESHGHKLGEDSDTDHPRSVYAALKKSPELICHSYHCLYGIGMVNARFFSVYGPGGRPDQIVYKIVEAVSNDLPLARVEPDPTRDFTYIEDIVDALALMLNLPKACYHTINLGRGEPVSITALVALVERTLGRRATFNRVEHPPASDIASTHADWSEAKRILGWEPHTSLEEGMLDFVKWYQNQKT